MQRSRWDAHRADGYAWWLARMRATFEVCDIVRIDHLLGEGIVNELSRREQNNGIASIVGGVGYWGWEATDGSKTSGLRVAALNDGRTGFAHGIVYTLAAIVHGDRKAWGHMRLDRF